MRKLLTRGVLLIFSFLTVTANAKPLPFIPISPTTNDLSDRLAADRDFQNLSFSVYTLVGNLKKTNSNSLFLKYLKKQLSDSEKDVFLKNMGFANENDFFISCKQIMDIKNKVQEKFTELQTLSYSKQIVQSAGLKVAEQLNFDPKKKFQLTCWDIFLANVSICNLSCLYAQDYWLCFEICFGGASAAWGLCQLLEP